MTYSSKTSLQNRRGSWWYRLSDFILDSLNYRLLWHNNSSSLHHSWNWSLPTLNMCQAKARRDKLHSPWMRASYLPINMTSLRPQAGAAIECLHTSGSREPVKYSRSIIVEQVLQNQISGSLTQPSALSSSRYSVPTHSLHTLRNGSGTP